MAPPPVWGGGVMSRPTLLLWHSRSVFTATRFWELRLPEELADEGTVNRTFPWRWLMVATLSLPSEETKMLPREYV